MAHKRHLVMNQYIKTRHQPGQDWEPSWVAMLAWGMPAGTPTISEGGSRVSREPLTLVPPPSHTSFKPAGKSEHPVFLGHP